MPASKSARSGSPTSKGELIAQVIRSVLGDLGLNKKALLRWGGGSRLLGWRHGSDGEGKFGEDRLKSAAGLSSVSEFVVAAAQVLNERVPATDHLGAAEPFQNLASAGPLPGRDRLRSGCWRAAPPRATPREPARRVPAGRPGPGRWSPRSAVAPRSGPGRRTGGSPPGPASARPGHR